LKRYADEGVDRQIVNALRGAGFDVVYAADIDLPLPMMRFSRKRPRKADCF